MKTNKTKQAKELSNIEKKEKLNWLEKRMTKSMIKKAKKMIKKHAQTIETEAKSRTILENELLSMKDILDIELDNGEELNETNIKELSNKEIEETLEQTLEEMEKLLWKNQQ